MIQDKPKRNSRASPFILKLSLILSQPQNEHLISWSPCNSSFVVHQPYEFSSTLLPKHFRHRNYGSFLRQLNFYNFTKVKNQDDSVHQFRHPLFRRGQEDSYVFIKRDRNAGEGRSPQPDCPHFQILQPGTKQLKSPLQSKILNLQQNQKRLISQCQQAIEQGTETLEWGLIHSAQIEDDSSHSRTICHRLSDLIQSNPELSQHLAYIDTDMITKLINFLNQDLTQTFPQSYKQAISKLFNMIQNSEGWMVIELMRNSILREKKKSKTFTIIDRQERRKGTEQLLLGQMSALELKGKQQCQ